MIIDLSLPRITLKRGAEPVDAGAAEERALAQRVAESDPQAVAEIYDRHATSLYRVLVTILGSQADAEDALQEVFARLAGGRTGRIRDLRAYLFTAVRNEAYGILRRRKREQPLAEMEMQEHELSAADHDASNEDNSHLMVLLQQLPMEQREVIALKVFEELTFAQIAAIVQASPNTVASRYRYGIERLRLWHKEEIEGGEQ